MLLLLLLVFEVVAADMLFRLLLLPVVVVGVGVEMDPSESEPEPRRRGRDGILSTLIKEAGSGVLGSLCCWLDSTSRRRAGMRGA